MRGEAGYSGRRVGLPFSSKKLVGILLGPLWLAGPLSLVQPTGLPSALLSLVMFTNQPA